MLHCLFGRKQYDIDIKRRRLPGKVRDEKMITLPSAKGAGRRPWALTSKLMKRYWIFYLFFLPVAVYYIVFRYVPMPGIQIAFKDYSFRLGIWGSPWTSDYGFKHFIRFLTNGEFTRVFGNTLTLTFLGLFIGFPCPIILALLLNEMKMPKYKRFIQSVSYLPHFVSFVVVYAIMHNLFSLNGLVNGIRDMLGMNRIIYLGDKGLYKWFYVFSGVWQGVGWSSIIYLAQLSRVDVEQYEAADIDGAKRMQKIWYITLPCLRPLISLQLVMAMGGILNVGLTKTMVMMNDMVRTVAETTSYYVYYTGLMTVNQYSYSAAVGLFEAVLSLALVIFTNWAAKKVDEDGGIW